ncbi:MAG: adenosine deaminase [Actinobacteria bacterium]|nr:adenosine deaminase [Actinomycetota bacterium]
MAEVSLAEITALPKSLLHDHLDGGLRPATILELAGDIGHELPTSGLDELAAWFVSGANTKDIVQYLATFEHTVAVMQTQANLKRVAYEAAADLAADGVVYAEVRFAPENHQLNGLALDEIMEAVQDGFRAGMVDAMAAGSPITVNTIVCAMRQADRSLEMAKLAVDWSERDGRVVAFDLAGPETGFPPTDHPEALDLVRRSQLHLTLHASEPPGLELISQALSCGAERIGHGVRLGEDIEYVNGEMNLGRLARYVLERQIPLEMAPSCHVQVGAVRSFEEHPLVRFHRHGFVVTINTDNRLMSGVSVSSETHKLATTFDLTRQELCELAVAGVESSFGQWSERRRLVDEVIRPAYAS